MPNHKLFFKKKYKVKQNGFCSSGMYFIDSIVSEYDLKNLGLFTEELARTGIDTITGHNKYWIITELRA